MTSTVSGFAVAATAWSRSQEPSLNAFRRREQGAKLTQYLRASIGVDQLLYNHYQTTLDMDTLRRPVREEVRSR